MVLQDVWATAQEPNVLRLAMKDAVTTALKQNPQVQIANLNVALTQQDAAIAKSAMLPQVRAEACFARAVGGTGASGRAFGMAS